MSAAIAARRVGRGIRIPIARGYVGAGLAVATVVALVALGVFPAKQWAPFTDPRVLRFLAEGLAITGLIGGVSLVASLVIGVPLGMARAAVRGPLGLLIRAWIEIVRATPVLAILLLVFLGLPRIGVDLPAIQAAIVGLTVYTSAVLAEIVRAGIGSIPRGVVEASRSLGLGYGKTMRLVVLPIALGRMMPALVSQLITLVKDTSLAFILGAQELIGYGRSLFNFYGNPVETYMALALVYFLICYSLSIVSRRLEAGRRTDRIVVVGEEDQAV